MLAACMLLKLLPLPTKKLATTALPKLALLAMRLPLMVAAPLTVNEVKFPILVILGCALVVTTPAKLAKLAPDPPGKLDSKLPSPIKYAPVTLPVLDTLNLELPPTFISINVELAPLVVSVIEAVIVLNVTAPFCHV